MINVKKIYRSINFYSPEGNLNEQQVVYTRKMAGIQSSEEISALLQAITLAAICIGI